MKTIGKHPLMYKGWSIINKETYLAITNLVNNWMSIFNLHLGKNVKNLLIF